MAAISEPLRELRGLELKKLISDVSIITDPLGEELIKNIADSKFPMWVNELPTEGYKRNEAMFRAYMLEDKGILSSKLEHKERKLYERRFFATELGKKIAKDLAK